MRVRPPPPRQRPKAKSVRVMPLVGGLVATLLLTMLVVWLTQNPAQSPMIEGLKRTGEHSPQALAPTDAQNRYPAAKQPMTASPTHVSQGRPFACLVVKVHDGDGPVWCSEGERVRLAGIAAREINESCRPKQPCPMASGASAQGALERMVLGKLLSCRQVGTSYNRTVAWCRLPSSEDVSCAMIETGTTLRWERYDPDRRLVGCAR